MVLALCILSVVGCSESGSQAAPTPIAEESSSDLSESATQQPTFTPLPTDRPSPTEPPAVNKIGVGAHLVGEDIEPGIYMGQAGAGILESCYWERLSGLSGEFSDLIANENSVGQFYVEVLAADVALSTDCELVNLDDVPSLGAFPTQLLPGTFIVGRDIQSGIYSGEAGTGVLDSCYWARLSGLSGEFYDLIANENAQGRFYVEVMPTDFAVNFACAVSKTD